MSYFVAIGTSDNKNVDLKFGAVEEFYIYKVEESKYELFEKRICEKKYMTDFIEDDKKENIECNKNVCSKDSCTGDGHGCNGGSDILKKVEVISDCRCVLCTKVGFQAQKQLERKAIAVFDIACSIVDALDRISTYYNKIDNHMSLRKIEN